MAAVTATVASAAYGMKKSRDAAKDAKKQGKKQTQMLSDSLAKRDGPGVRFDKIVDEGAKYTDDMISNPSEFADSKGLLLGDKISAIDENAPGTTLNKSDYSLDPSSLKATTKTVDNVSLASKPEQPAPAVSYEASTSIDEVNNNLAVAATMDTSEESLVGEEKYAIDLQGTATGVNEDGSLNYTGQAVNDFVHQNISEVIDTSTVAGKMIAEKLGEGNYIDSKATVKGQLEILTAEFVDAKTGEPRIPTWAASIARNVSSTIAFRGITGTAATAALSQALIEATLPIAKADSKFYETLTILNIDNKQQAVINKANILSKMELVDLDNRTQIAVNNAKTFMNYDLANLDNEQQTAVINSQSKVQALLEDSNQVNLARRFKAEADNEMGMFYSELGANIDIHNSSQINAMKKFNIGEVNDIAQFNAELENNREQFYLNTQYTVDAANALWRQNVTTKNTAILNEAASADVKTLLGITTEGLNKMWDRQDSLLDYAWQEIENVEDRKAKISTARAGRAKSSGGGAMGAIGSMAGNFLGTEKGSGMMAAGLDKAGAAISTGFSKVTSFFSDERLKTNIQHYDTLDNGVKLYTWEWNEIAKEKGADTMPTYGVVAQDVRKHFPDAVHVGDDGYLRVDYNKVVQ